MKHFGAIQRVSPLRVGVVVSALLLWSQFSGLAEDAPNASGYLVTRDGRTVTFTRLDDSSRMLMFKYGPEMKSTTIPLASVREVLFGEKSEAARIALNDGRSLDAKCYWVNNGNPYWKDHNESGPNLLGYFYFDDVSQKENLSSESFDKIARIVLHENVGRFRRCTHCKALWPDSYLFCPQDGVATVWGEAAGSLTVMATPSPAQKAERDKNLVDAVLNASLARSGIDPASKEAEKAKDFGKLWMNPAADPKEILQKLEEIRKEFLQNSGSR